MKNFNDSVVYILNGKSIPAIVIKSAMVENEEFLTLLYADPVNGPGQINAGTFRSIGQVAVAVPPYAEGKQFAWQDNAAAELPEGTLSAEAAVQLRRDVADTEALAKKWESQNEEMIVKLNASEAENAELKAKLAPIEPAANEVVQEAPVSNEQVAGEVAQPAENVPEVAHE